MLSFRRDISALLFTQYEIEKSVVPKKPKDGEMDHDGVFYV